MLEGDAPHSFLLFLLGVQAALSLGVPGTPLHRAGLCVCEETFALSTAL